MDLAVKLLHPQAKLPERAHPGDAGADLFSVEEVTIPPGERRDVGTGLALAIPWGYAGFVQPRSGLAFKHGIMVVNSPGLIDAGYRGEVRVSLYNSGRIRSSSGWGRGSPNWSSRGWKTPSSSRRSTYPKRSGERAASAVAGGEQGAVLYGALR